MKRRRGYSLIECIVTFALMGTAMTTVAVSISGMQRACQRVREATRSEMELQRLAGQLRADAHEALSGGQAGGKEEGKDAPADTLRLILGEDEVVQYTLSAGEVRREQRRKEEVLCRESYHLPAGCTARWIVETQGAHPIVSLQLEPQALAANGQAGLKTAQITAAVGLLRQAEATKGGKQS